MLAQSFKTAKQLRLSDKQFEALRLTLVLFETGKVTHISTGEYNFRGSGKMPKEGENFKFNMADWSAYYHKCGSVHCIGGTAELVGGCEFNTDDADSTHDLFFPHAVADWRKIDVEQAARAIRNFLTTGKPKWKQIVPKDNYDH